MRSPSARSWCVTAVCLGSRHTRARAQWAPILQASRQLSPPHPPPPPNKPRLRRRVEDMFRKSKSKVLVDYASEEDDMSWHRHLSYQVTRPTQWQQSGVAALYRFCHACRRFVLFPQKANVSEWRRRELNVSTVISSCFDEGKCFHCA